jgi:hypothetical protein
VPALSIPAAAERISIGREPPTVAGTIRISSSPFGPIVPRSTWPDSAVYRA